MAQCPKRVAKIVVRCSLLAMAAWGALAIYYSNLPPLFRPPVALGFGVGTLYLLLRSEPERVLPRTSLVPLAVVLTWWLLIPPSNARRWQPDVAVLPWAEIRGDLVTIHDIRNCDYRSETDYTVRHYDRTFHLSKLRSVDLSLVYWGSPMIAHTMLSFGFGDGGVVCFSVETRKEVGEAYSTVKGFFRQYELTYVVADERDLIRLRTNYRGERVYLYRLNASRDLARRVFLDYLRRVNSLKERPEWYNALTSNCTTNIRSHVAPFNPGARLDWRILVNGYVDEMLYERGAVDTTVPFAELKRKSLINGRARLADDAANFSQLVRVGLPGKELNR